MSQVIVPFTSSDLVRSHKLGLLPAAILDLWEEKHPPENNSTQLETASRYVKVKAAFDLGVVIFLLLAIAGGCGWVFAEDLKYSPWAIGVGALMCCVSLLLRLMVKGDMGNQMDDFGEPLAQLVRHLQASTPGVPATKAELLQRAEFTLSQTACSVLAVEREQPIVSMAQWPALRVERWEEAKSYFEDIYKIFERFGLSGDGYDKYFALAREKLDAKVAA
jgi:hypothetical protein